MVNFVSYDSLLISADHYFSKKSNPYILLFHTEASSRGEMAEIAERFVKMNYNCLCVDLRSGNQFGYVRNETAARAKEAGLLNTLADSEKDILAAINYANTLNDNKVLLLGSSFSAGLCIKAAENNPFVATVLAFSPGEFFSPYFDVSNIVINFDKKIFVTGATGEVPYILEMFSGMEPEKLSLYKPSVNTVLRGADLLKNMNPASDEFWLAVLIFIKSFQI